MCLCGVWGGGVMWRGSRAVVCGGVMLGAVVCGVPVARAMVCRGVVLPAVVFRAMVVVVGGF